MWPLVSAHKCSESISVQPFPLSLSITSMLNLINCPSLSLIRDLFIKHIRFKTFNCYVLLGTFAKTGDIIIKKNANLLFFFFLSLPLSLCFTLKTRALYFLFVKSRRARVK